MLKPNGYLNFGGFAPDIADELNILPGKIRLAAGDDRYGAKHINIRHIDEIQKAGYENVSGFINDILSNWNEIREGTDGKLFIVLAWHG